MTFLSSSKELPIWNLHFGGQEMSLVVSTKHLKAFAVPLARKTPFTLDEAIFLPELHLPSCGRIFPYVMLNIAHWESRGCVSRLLCS
jgi:hypothetical protein